ncbi:hypothetical protein GCM10023332_05780 [Luteimonas vadosa]|uniref:histidine kinase n=2 Tax=Luteimonas vadosa TaxID=1165507 RepID=A0ABP9DQQ9_9GAMM
MALVDVDARWLQVNPALERMLGKGADTLAGRPVADAVHPDDAGELRRQWQALADGGQETLAASLRCLRPGGDVVHVALHAGVMRGDGGEPLYFIAQLRDDSARHAAEAALREMDASLERRVTERTATLEHAARQQELFAHGVSHDLRAPLRAIEGFARLLATRYGDALDEAGRGYLDRISGAVERMGGLIDSLLELSRATRTELKAEVVDLSLIAEWTYAELQEKDPGRDADLQVQQDLVVRGDERHLKLLFDHLLQNAWKFSRDREQVRIRVSGERLGDRLVVSVRDEGAGFDMRYADKVFEPFQRLHPPEQGGGHGLGLAIAQRIAERHGGRISAESAPGEGAVFRIELPVHDDSEEIQA